MTRKWDTKEAMRCLEEKIDPFEKEQGKLTGIAEKINQILGRNKEVKPQ